MATKVTGDTDIVEPKQVKKKHKTKVIVKRRNRGGLGTFFGGMLLGMVFLVAILAGVGITFYKYVTIDNLKGIVGELPIGNDESEINGMTVEQFVNFTVTFFSDSNNFTINKLTQAFGISQNLVSIPDKLWGIDISSLKDAKFSELGSEVSNLFNNISLCSFVELGISLPDIGFLNDLKDKPLLEVFDEISSMLDFENITANDLKQNFGVDLTNVPILKNYLNTPLNELSSVLENATINDIFTAQDIADSNILTAIADTKITELGTKFNNITIGELFPGETSGILFNLKNKKITELGTAMQDLKIGEIIEVSQQDGILYELRESTLDSIAADMQTLKLGKLIAVDENSSNLLKALADYQVNELGGAIDLLTVEDIFPNPTGVLSLVDQTTPISNLPEELSDVFSDATIQTLIDAGIIEDNAFGNELKEMTIQDIIDEYQRLKELESQLPIIP